MSKKLNELLELAKHVNMTEAQLEQQRISFAYGNTKFENERITKDTVTEAAEKLRTDAKNGRSAR